MGFIAAGIGVAALGVGAAVMGYVTAPKRAPKFNYREAYKGLDEYMESSLGAYSQVNAPAFSGDASYNPVNAVNYGNQAINFNIQNMDAFGDMASASNERALSDRISALDVISPQWQAQRDQADKTNMALQKGEIPLDVQQNMARSSAYQSFQAGYSGSPSGRQGTLARDLGLTSLSLSQMGQLNSQSWLKTNSEIAMPDQVSSADMMENIGFDAKLTTGTAITNAGATTATQVGNLDRRQQANQAASTFGLQKAAAVSDIFGDRLNVKLAMESQKLADKQAQTEMTQKANAALWGGIGSSIGSGAGMAFGGI